MKKILKIGGIIFLVIIVLSVIGSMGNKGSSTNSASTNQTSTSNTGSSNKQAETVSIAKIGEEVVDSEIGFTATDTQKAATLGNQYTKKTAQGQFYIVTIKIENKSKETKTIDSSMITLTDSQGRKFDRSIDGQTAKGLAEGKVDLFLQQVQPGLNVTGDIVFDIPKDATGLKLNVKGGYFGKEKQIELGE